jgi:hypothetical protein
MNKKIEEISKCYLVLHEILCEARHTAFARFTIKELQDT